MNRTNLKIPDPLPTWFVVRKPDSLLNARDVAELFGFARFQNVHISSSKGDFPKPDLHLGGHASSPKSQWLKSTLMKEIERRKKILAKESA